MKTTEASLHSKAACSASLCARVAAAATVAVAAHRPTPHIAASAPPPPPPPPRRLVHEKGKLPSLEVRHGTHYVETACGAKCKRVVQRELENTSVAHKEIRSIFFPLPYEDSSRAVIGVK